MTDLCNGDISSFRQCDFLCSVSFCLYAMPVICNVTCRHWWAMALANQVNQGIFTQTYWVVIYIYLTCSLISNVVPDPSTHFPRNNSPRKGFNGFLMPISSLPPAYCCRFSEHKVPFQNQKRAFLCTVFQCRGNEDFWEFRP
jgi:hypothetical protein